MSNLKILVNKEKNKSVEYDLHEFLLQPPFNALFIAPTCSGKSLLALNILKNNNFGYNKIFKKIFYFSPSLQSDKTLWSINEDEDIIKITEDEDLTNNEDILKEIVEQQKENQMKGINDQILIVYDDMLPYLKSSSYIGKLFTLSRHYNISIILTSQHYTSIPLKARNNSQMIIIFKLFNDSEIYKINHEIGNQFHYFLEFYNKCVNEPYGFIYCDLRHMKLYNKFDELLWSKIDYLKNLK